VTRESSGRIGEVLALALTKAADEVAATEEAALADEPDGVHQQRVRVRRLRSILAGFRNQLDTRAAERVRVAYAEWGRELGVVRDIEVRAAVAEETLQRAGVDDLDVFRRLVLAERDAYDGAHARLVELAGEPRAVARREMMRTFVDAPAIVGADTPVAEVAAEVLRTQARRVTKAAHRLDGTDDAYHALRKSARRLRYVAEAVADAAPGLYAADVADLAAAGDALHESLGGHRDATLFAEHVVREGIRAARAGERSDAYPFIEAIVRTDAETHLRRLPDALQRLRAAASDLP
jgi:CHAD domain-containing protein